MKYAGNYPTGEDWVLVGEKLLGKKNWIVMKKHYQDNFFNVKVFLEKGKMRKANFWLGFNADKKTFTESKDKVYAEENYPGFLEHILPMLTNCESENRIQE